MSYKHADQGMDNGLYSAAYYFLYVRLRCVLWAVSFPADGVLPAVGPTRRALWTPVQ